MSTRGNSQRGDSFSNRLLLAVVVAVVSVPTIILTYFVVEQETVIRDHERRITALETEFKYCVDCSGGQERDLGGFRWRRYRSAETGDGGQVVFAVDIDILSEEYRWDCGSATTIVKENDPTGHKYDIGEVIAGYSPENELKDAKKVVAVGTASSEGDQADQERLAGNRIETLINKIKGNLQKQLPIYGIDFGQYTKGEATKKCSTDTAAQRRVLIVKVTQLKEGMSDAELGESLKRRFVALAEDKSQKFPIDIRDYSMYQKGAEMLVYGRKSAQ